MVHKNIWVTITGLADILHWITKTGMVFGIITTVEELSTTGALHKRLARHAPDVCAILWRKNYSALVTQQNCKYSSFNSSVYRLKTICNQILNRRKKINIVSHGHLFQRPCNVHVLWHQIQTISFICNLISSFLHFFTSLPQAELRISISKLITTAWNFIFFKI